MKFTLFDFIINKIDSNYGIYFFIISSVYEGSKGLLYFEYNDNEIDWDFLFIHYII